MKISVFLLTVFLFNASLLANEDLLSEARKVYYKASKDEDYLEKAFSKFKYINKNYEEHDAISTVYIGSIFMLKARYSFWPQDKLKYAYKGLDILDAGLEKNPENIESQFIYASTCYFLPFFFGKKDSSKRKLHKIIDSLDNNIYEKYDNYILTKAMEFILEYIDISKSQRNKVNMFLRKLAENKN